MPNQPNASRSKRYIAYRPSQQTCWASLVDLPTLRWFLPQFQKQGRTGKKVWLTWWMMNYVNLTISDAAFTLSTAPMGSDIRNHTEYEWIGIREKSWPPCLTWVPTVGNSTKTTSPSTSWAWSVIPITPTPVSSSKFTISCSDVYFLAVKIGICEKTQLRTSNNTLCANLNWKGEGREGIRVAWYLSVVVASRERKMAWKLECMIVNERRRWLWIVGGVLR